MNSIEKLIAQMEEKQKDCKEMAILKALDYIVARHYDGIAKAAKDCYERSKVWGEAITLARAVAQEAKEPQ